MRSSHTSFGGRWAAPLLAILLLSAIAMSGAAQPRKRGRPPHPCAKHYHPLNTVNRTCSHCDSAVDKDASIASAHLLYQCPAIAAEARAAFTAELQGGLHPVVQLADLPEGKRARYDAVQGALPLQQQPALLVAVPGITGEPAAVGSRGAARAPGGQGSAPGGQGSAPGGQAHPCWAEVHRSGPRARKGLCWHCHAVVPNDASVATAHVLFQCEVITSQKRQWFRQQMARRGLAIEPMDALAPAQRAAYDGIIGQPATVGSAVAAQQLARAAATAAVPGSQGQSDPSSTNGVARLGEAAAAPPGDQGDPGSSNGAAGAGRAPAPTLRTLVQGLEQCFAEHGATEAALRDGGATASTSGSGRPGAHPEFVERGGWSEDMLAFAQRHCSSFDEECGKFIANMAACAWCGRTALGGRHCELRSGMKGRPSQEAPPALLANPLLADFVCPPCDPTNPEEPAVYWACSSCWPATAAGAKRRQKQADWLQAPVISSSLAPEDVAAGKEWMQMLGLLVSLPAGSALQLSVLKCGVRFAQDLRSYVHAMQPNEQQALLGGPLINWGDAAKLDDASTGQLIEHFEALVDHLRRTNPVVQQFTTMYEQNFQAAGAAAAPEQQQQAVPIVASTTLGPGVAASQARDPRATAPAVGGDCQLTATMPEHTQQHTQRTMFCCGQVLPRDGGGAAEQVASDAAGASTSHQGLSFDAAMFPFLHPGGHGAFRSGESLSTMLKQRMQQLLSPFCLQKEYVLLMYQVEAVASLVKGVGESVLYSCLEAEKARHPDDSLEQQLSRVASHVVPPAVPGSPAYHRQGLEDLLAMVDQHGLPSFFLTLTADETSELRWPEVPAFEALLKGVAFSDSWSWRDMPCQMAALFHERVQHFMQQHVLAKDNPILGRVNHHTVRYESQHRGSLHAHILLWVDPADAAKVAQEITATRCNYAPDHDAPGPAGCPWRDDVHLSGTNDLQQMTTEERLHRLVQRKQIHTCRAGPLGCCRGDRPCRYGFPFPPNLDGTYLEAKSGRYQYSRFCALDQMVVPYHPAVLLAWGAHMNIQCVTESSWSFYVLKYAAKMMLPTNFKLDATSLSSLGLDGISEQHAQLAAASVLLKTVCPCEAHHILAGRPIIYHSDKITYVPTHPPEWRRLQILYRNGAQQVVSGTTALQTYLQRPQCPVFDNYTLVEYFQYFEVRRKKDKSRPDAAVRGLEAWRDQAGNHVWLLAAPRLIRRPISSPANANQSFYYNLLLSHIPTRAEQDLVPEDRDYFKHCVRRGVFTTQAELDGYLQAYAEYNLWDEVKLNALRHKVCGGLQGEEVLGAVDEGGYVNTELLSGIAAMERIINAESNAQDVARLDPVKRLHQILQSEGTAPTPAATPVMQQRRREAQRACNPQLAFPLAVTYDALGEPQQRAIDAVLRQLDEAQQGTTWGPGTPSSRPIIVTLQGGPGTGKSAVLRVLVERAVAAGRSVLVTATSATAAHRLGFSTADTIDATAGLVARQNYGAMDPRSARKLALEAAGLVVVDEFSLMDSIKLSRIMHRLSQCTAAGAPPKVLLLVGDLWQLPPVCAHRLKDEDGAVCPDCHLLFSPDFLAGNHLHLKQVFRQAADPPFAAFLNYVRSRQPSAAYIEQVLGMCMRPRDNLEALLTADATILCTHKKDVRRHNATALLWHQRKRLLGSQVYEVHLQHDAPADGPAAAAAREFVARPNFHELTHVAVGARVIYNTTDDKSTGATNSAQGVVVEVITGDAPEGMQLPAGVPWVQAVHVLLDSGEPVIAERSIFKNAHPFGVPVHKATFPIQLAYAMTAHRAQGATLHGVTIIDVCNAFAAAIVYVMLSRSVRRDRLFILGGLTPDDFASIMPAPSSLTVAQRAKLPPQLLLFLQGLE